MKEIVNVKRLLLVTVRCTRLMRSVGEIEDKLDVENEDDSDEVSEVGEVYE